MPEISETSRCSLQKPTVEEEEKNEEEGGQEGKRRRRKRRRIERNRSKESCVLITQFHVLSVRSTSPAFVEAERS